MDYKKYREDAKKNIQVADHMLFVTYPLIKDPKLLLAVMENMFLTLTNSMRYLLYYERMFKRVPSFFDTFESKYRLFSEKIIGNYEINEEDLQFLRRIKNILVAHKRSPIEFARRDQFVICSDDYNLEVLGINDIKDYLNKTKKFFYTIDKIIKRNELNEGDKRAIA
jgi:hypothetical protein